MRFTGRQEIFCHNRTILQLKEVINKHIVKSISKQYFEQPIYDVIQKRRSIRTYEKKKLSPDMVKDLEHYLAVLEIPFSGKVFLKYIANTGQDETQKLGTYGVIRNAPAFIGIKAEKGPDSLVAAGFALEKVVLYAASRGLGTCWLGGTFQRSSFAQVLEVKENEVFPAITPIGYPQDKGHMMGNLVRKIAKSDQRMTWKELFFEHDFRTSLSEAAAGHLKMAFEAVRLGPSASNKQPWRIVADDNVFHFYMAKTPGYNEKLGYKIQEADMGIALCHFCLTAEETGVTVHLEKKEGIQAADTPEHMEYITSVRCL